MKRRCLNGNDKAFDRYGGNGIAVCARWSESFEAFLVDMGRKPAGMTIERIDNRRGYEPGNCRWATVAEQAANKTTSRHITALGRTMILAEWARESGLDHSLIQARLRYGWPPDRAVTERPRRLRRRR